jgi:CHAT domain-containing protein
MSLSRGFFHAGTSSVLVSLWDVGDQATSELMVRFYRGVLHEKLAPAKALRETQRAIRNSPGGAAPGDWAGFVLQGDWE